MTVSLKNKSRQQFDHQSAEFKETYFTVTRLVGLTTKKNTKTLVHHKVVKLKYVHNLG